MGDTNVAGFSWSSNPKNYTPPESPNGPPRNWRSLREDEENMLYSSDSEDDYMRHLDHRWLHEMHNDYANDPYHQHYAYDNYYDNKGKKGKKGKGKKKGKKDKEKEEEDKRKAEEDRKQRE